MHRTDRPASISLLCHAMTRAYWEAGSALSHKPTTASVF